MKDTLKAGMTFSRKITVDRERTIAHLGEDLRVYATPDLLRDIERTCLEFIAEHAEAGEHSVGMSVQELRHMAPTPEGWEVELTATVEKVDGRQIFFDVVGHDKLDQVLACKHGRFVVDIAKLKQRVAAKLAKAEEG